MAGSLSCTWSAPKSYTLWIDSPVSVQLRLDRNSSGTVLTFIFFHYLNSKLHTPALFPNMLPYASLGCRWCGEMLASEMFVFYISQLRTVSCPALLRLPLSTAMDKHAGDEV